MLLVEGKGQAHPNDSGKKRGELLKKKKKSWLRGGGHDRLKPSGREEILRGLANHPQGGPWHALILGRWEGRQLARKRKVQPRSGKD